MTGRRARPTDDLLTLDTAPLRSYDGYMRQDITFASDEDRSHVSRGQYVMTTYRSTTVHVRPNRKVAVTYCGKTYVEQCYGEENRMPMCRRCAVAVHAEYDAMLSDDDELDQVSKR